MKFIKKMLLIVMEITVISNGLYASEQPSTLRSIYDKYIQRAKTFPESTEVDKRRVALKAIEAEYKPEGFFGWAKRLWSKSLYDMPITEVYAKWIKIPNPYATKQQYGKKFQTPVRIGDLIKKRQKRVRYDYNIMKPDDWISLNNPQLDYEIGKVKLAEEERLLNTGIKKATQSNKVIKEAIAQEANDWTDAYNELNECKNISRKMGHCDAQERRYYLVDDAIRFDRQGYTRAIENNEKTKKALTERLKLIRQRKKALTTIDEYEQHAAEQGQ